MAKRELKCEIYRPFKRTTIKKEGCKKLQKRFECFSMGRPSKKQGRVPIDFDDKNADNVAKSYAGFLEEYSNRRCPAIMVDEIDRRMRDKYPNHIFRQSRTQLKIPKSMPENEINDIKNNISIISDNWYVVRHNKRLGQYYISPKSKEELEKEQKQND